MLARTDVFSCAISDVADMSDVTRVQVNHVLWTHVERVGTERVKLLIYGEGEAGGEAGNGLTVVQQ